MMMKYSEIWQVLSSAKSVLIFAHHNPDGDAIGSATALGLTLKHLGKKVDYSISNVTSQLAGAMPEVDTFDVDSLEETYDIALIVDCSTREYIAHNENLSLCNRCVLIDHHMTNNGFVEDAIIEPGAAATGEIIFRILVNAKIEILPEVARSIYLSISSDTGCFSYANTTAETHRIISELYKIEQSLHKINDELKVYEPSFIDFMREATNNVKFYNNYKLGVIYLDLSDVTSNVETNLIIDIVRYVNICKMAVLVKKTAVDTYKVSMRAMADGLNVSDIAASFGGGGHEKAAGYTFMGNIEDIYKYFDEFAKTL